VAELLLNYFQGPFFRSSNCRMVITWEWGHRRQLLALNKFDFLPRCM